MVSKWIWAAGLFLAVLMCAINSYLTLKVGVIEEGFVLTFLLFFIGASIVKIFVKRGNITPLEGVMVATMGSAGGSLAFIANVFAALKLAGHDMTWLQMTVFSVLVSLGGALMAIPFRLLYVVKDPLPWPTGKVGVSSINAVLSGEDSIQPKVLAIGAIMAFTWMVMAGFEWVPANSMLPAALPFGLGAVGMGVAWSPFILGAGYLVGLRVGWGFGLGAVILAFMTPHLEPLGIAPHRYVWPGVMALLSCGITALVLQWRTIKAALFSLSPSGIKDVDEEDRVMSPAAFKKLIIVVFLVTVIGLKIFFRIPIYASSCGLLAAYTILNAIANRSAGETAFNPVRVMGVVVMVIFAVMGVNDSWSTLIGAGIAAAGIGATVLLVQDNYVGRAFGVPAKSQLKAQIFVLIPTSMVCAWVFILAHNTYGVGSDELPAAVAVLWTSVAQIFAGEAELPPFAIQSMVIGGIAGIILAFLDYFANKRIKVVTQLNELKKGWKWRTELAMQEDDIQELYRSVDGNLQHHDYIDYLAKWLERDGKVNTVWRFMPHSLGITLGMLLPIPYDMAFFVGAIVLCWLMPKFKVTNDALVGVAAAGIVGEGVGNLVVAILTAVGIITVST